jgi:hypothetical protein
MVDAVIALLLLTMTLWGYLRGGFYDLLGLAALVVAYAGSVPFAEPVGSALAGTLGLSMGVAYVLGRVAAGLLIFVSLKVSAMVLNRTLGQTPEGVNRPWNRNLGATIGFVTGLVIVLVLVFLADGLYKAFPDSSSGFIHAARRSHIRRLLSPYNPADRFLVTDVLRLIRVAREDPAVLEALGRDERIRTVMQDPAIRAVAEDRELMQAISDRELGQVLKNENLRNLLDNKELLGKVLSPDVRQAIRDAMEASGSTLPLPTDEQPSPGV